MIQFYFLFFSLSSSSRLLRSRTGTPNSIPDSPRSLDGRVSVRGRSSAMSAMDYDSEGSIRLDRASHGSMVQDILSIKTMLLKLRRVLNEVKLNL